MDITEVVVAPHDTWLFLQNLMVENRVVALLIFYEQFYSKEVEEGSCTDFLSSYISEVLYLD